MKEHIQEVYNYGLEKYAGDETKAKEFTIGFMKEAAAPLPMTFGQNFGKGLATALGTGVVGLGLGLGIHGMSSAFNSAGVNHLRGIFQTALSKAIASNPILTDADPAKVNSYAETIFKFAPHVACDPNLLSSILANAVHGEGIDPMTIRTIADLDGRIIETRKNSLFTPKTYG
jgi:hypothetical protein